MTLRDLSEEQIKKLQAASVEEFEADKKRRYQQRLGTQKQEKIWQTAFSAGIKAALALIKRGGEIEMKEYVDDSGILISVILSDGITSTTYGATDPEKRGYKLRYEPR